MVEFALVAPLFFLLLFGIIEAGRFIFYYETLNHATREGARYAIVNGANTLGCPSRSAGTRRRRLRRPRQQRRRSCPSGRRRRAPAPVTGRPVLVDTVCDFATHGRWDNARGATVTVTASYTYSSLIPLVPLPPITVTAESSLVINN